MHIRFDLTMIAVLAIGIAVGYLIAHAETLLQSAERLLRLVA